MHGSKCWPSTLRSRCQTLEGRAFTISAVPLAVWLSAGYRKAAGVVNAREYDETAVHALLSKRLCMIRADAVMSQ